MSAEAVIPDDYVPITQCRYCHEWVPAHLDEYHRDADGAHVGIWSCPNCELVWNLEQDFEPEWVSPEECELRTGWKRVPEEEPA